MVENWMESPPSGLASCVVDGREVAILRLSQQRAVVRMVSAPTQIDQVTFSFYRSKTEDWGEIFLRQPSVAQCVRRDRWWEVTLRPENAAYSAAAQALLQDYNQFALLRLTGGLSQQRLGYPEELDDQFFSCFETQKAAWFSTCSAVTGKIPPVEVALSISDPTQYEAYRTIPLEDYVRRRLAENNLLSHPLAALPVRRLYLGSGYCPHLLPSWAELAALGNKALAEGVFVTVVLPPMAEDQVEAVHSLLIRLEQWCQDRHITAEVAVNDLGTASLLRSFPSLTPILGILLHHRRKDPRLSYLPPLPGETGLNSPLVQDFLRRTLGIIRYSYEPGPLVLPSRGHSLHLPWYQTNTGTFCPLFAACTTGQRGKQQAVTHCPRCCQETVFTYPTHLRMVGRYNSLFALDTTLLTDLTQLNARIHQGIDRIVWELL